MSALIALLMGANISGCTADTDAQSAYHAIEVVNEAATTALEAGDVETYASYFTEDAWSMPPNSPANKGREAIIASFSGMAQFGTIKFNLETLDVSVCGPSAAERGAYVLTFTPFDASSPIPAIQDEGHYLVHWVEQDGKWLIRTDAPVSTLPLPMPASPE